MATMAIAMRKKVSAVKSAEACGGWRLGGLRVRGLALA
jgi:hypothetical protein